MCADNPQGLWPPLSYVYTKNPFYFISMAFVLYGIVHGVDPGAKPFLMAGILVGYCSLLAAAGYAIVRYGQVWDDARSVLLILLFLFVALSISLDEVVTADLTQGAAGLLACLLFCVGISAVLFRGLKIRLPVAYQVPSYAILTLLFAFPLVPAIVSQKLLGRSVLDWAVISLSPVSGLMFLLLVPAVRCGAGYVKCSGTPWRRVSFIPRRRATAPDHSGRLHPPAQRACVPNHLEGRERSGRQLGDACRPRHAIFCTTSTPLAEEKHLTGPGRHGPGRSSPIRVQTIAREPREKTARSLESRSLRCPKFQA